MPLSNPAWGGVAAVRKRGYFQARDHRRSRVEAIVCRASVAVGAGQLWFDHLVVLIIPSLFRLAQAPVLDKGYGLDLPKKQVLNAVGHL